MSTDAAGLPTLLVYGVAITLAIVATKAPAVGWLRGAAQRAVVAMLWVAFVAYSLAAVLQIVNVIADVDLWRIGPEKWAVAIADGLTIAALAIVLVSWVHSSRERGESK